MSNCHYFTPDNTDGYTRSELDYLNMKLDIVTNGIIDMNTIKYYADLVLANYDHEIEVNLLSDGEYHVQN